MLGLSLFCTKVTVKTKSLCFSRIVTKSLIAKVGKLREGWTRPGKGLGKKKALIYAFLSLRLLKLYSPQAYGKNPPMLVPILEMGFRF
jgi:hypothetical protein